MAEELVRLVELRDRGDLSPEEFGRAKARLLVEPAPATSSPDGAMVLYHTVTAGQRRAAALLAMVAVLFGAVALWSVSRYAALREQVDAVEDAALVDRFGVRIPDPRPAIEQAELHVRPPKDAPSAPG
ncbi:MAG: SHOCT domain-containing protein [Gaiellaceae bacterium]